MNTNIPGVRTREYPKPDTVECPYNESYACDVLVIGCGFAGLNAAVNAKLEGCSVLVVDKGKPGYSGLSAWPSSFRWFDPDRGDDADAFRKSMQRGGDYLTNLNWYEKWIKESKGIYERLTEWGILAQYPKAADTGTFYEREDFAGYREYFDKFDRHKKFTAVLDRYEIPYLQHTMAANLLVKDGRVCGAVGFHVQSGKVISVDAKAVVLATGTGAYKPTGYPVGGDTFDGEYMAYQLGLPITGKEFEDFHKTPAAAPGNAFFDNHWQYLENIWLCGGDIDSNNVLPYSDNKGRAMVCTYLDAAVERQAPVDGTEIQDVSKAMNVRRGGSNVYGKDPREIRSGKMSTPTIAAQLPGAAVGMSCHLTAGVFCGLEDDTGFTGFTGLYVCGDGTHATSPSGTAYPCGVGFTSCFTSIDGCHAGTAAGKFAFSADSVTADEKLKQEICEEIFAPYAVQKGFDPNWARDVLHSIMAPYWVSVAKSEPMLNSALTQVLYMKENVVPYLAAASSHDLRLCLEVKHKVLDAEIKLRASLERKESRGMNCRTDYPFRDDKNFLCYILMRKGEDGGMVSEKVELPEAWKGDTTQPYAERYGFYHPGERKAMGIPEPEPKKGGWKK